MRFSFYLVPVMGDLLTQTSGLCQRELGVKFVIFHQADRVVAIAVILKQLCFFNTVAEER